MTLMAYLVLIGRRGYDTSLYYRKRLFKDWGGVYFIVHRCTASLSLDSRQRLKRVAFVVYQTIIDRGRKKSLHKLDHLKIMDVCE